MNNGNERLDRRHFENKMIEAVMQYSMLKHPFYQAWSEGRLNQSILAEYAKQYYAHVSAFPAYVSAIHSHCDNLPIRQELLENLIEEERGAENHPELWLRFAEGLGANREDVAEAELLPATRESVASLKALTQDPDYRQGLAALYAYESQIPEVARTKRKGLKSFYQITDERAVSFFRVHETIDLLHKDVALRILCEECDTNSAQAAAIAAAGDGAKALWGFLDGVADAYLSEAADCNVATA
ncbi:MAG: pyrroloquinoline-quinone synthase [Blastocatellia bacterium]|jgi:pyrroloquinoline-quinone synthase|nr:pyrroloquinoline-quinone synthase [Blastocatellia bacterium]